MSHPPDDATRVARALQDVGLPVSSIWDLVNARDPYPEAVPVLVRFLEEDLDSQVMEGIVRALTTRRAGSLAAKPLIRLFERIDDADSSLKWAVGNALSVVADDDVFEEVVGLVRDEHNGRSREMLVEALGNIGDPRAIDLLIELLRSDELSGHALVALRKLKAAQARPYIAPLLHHPTPWIRKQAKMTMSALDKAARTIIPSS